MTSNLFYAKRIYDEAIRAKYIGNLDHYKNMHINDIYKADSLLREIVVNVPSNYNALKLYGKFHIDLISIINNQILDPLEKALELKPNEIEILHILGDLYQHQFDAMQKVEDFQKSLLHYGKILEIEPNNKIVIERLKNLILLRFSINKEISKKNLEIIEKYVKNSKHEVDIFSKLGDMYYHIGEYEKALESYKKYRNLKAGAYGISHYIAQCYIKLNRIKKAIAVYEENINKLDSLKYKSIDYKQILYDLYKAEGFDIIDKSEVKNFINKRKKEKALAAEFHANGENFLKEGEIEAAINNFTKALEMDPLRLDSQLFITGINSKNNKSIRAEIDEIKQKYHEDVTFWSDLAKMYDSLGKYHDAVEAYKNYLKFQPNDTKIRSKLGLTLSKDDKFNEAIKIFEELIENNPRTAIERYNLGIVYARMKNYNRALEYYVDALSRFKNSNQIIKSIVDAHHQLSNFDLARAYLNVILRRNPNDNFAKEKIAQLSNKI